MKKTNKKTLPVKAAIQAYRSGYEISDFFDGREDVFEMLGEAMTLEEMLDARDAANAQVITERVTKQVTEQMTQQNIAIIFKILTQAGLSRQDAVRHIMKEYDMTMEQIKNII